MNIDTEFNVGDSVCYLSGDNIIHMYLANLHTSFLCNLIYPTFSRILLYSC